MGAWGVGIFDDDTAMDFLNALTDSENPLKLKSCGQKISMTIRSGKRISSRSPVGSSTNYSSKYTRAN
jgi:hypothetical protein